MHGLTRETGTMGKGIPGPELAEQRHPNDSSCIATMCTALQADGHVATSSVNETLTKSRIKVDHGIIMLVGYKLCTDCAGRC